MENRDKRNFMVDLDMYRAFIGQLKKENMYIKEILNDEEESQEKEVRANRDDKLICSQVLYKDGKKPAEYYIFADPDKEDARPPRGVRKIELKTPQEVQALMNGLKMAGLLK